MPSAAKPRFCTAQIFPWPLNQICPFFSYTVLQARRALPLALRHAFVPPNRSRPPFALTRFSPKGPRPTTVRPEPVDAPQEVPLGDDRRKAHRAGHAPHQKPETTQSYCNTNRITLRPRFSDTYTLPFESTAIPCAWLNSPTNAPGRPKLARCLPLTRSKTSICALFWFIT